MRDEEQRPQGISRRTIARAAVWSVPVIAMAAAVPAYAASPGPPGAPTFLKLYTQYSEPGPNQRTYVFSLAIQSDGEPPYAVPTNIPGGVVKLAFDLRTPFSGTGVFIQAITTSDNWSAPVVDGFVHTFTYLQELQIPEILYPDKLGITFRDGTPAPGHTIGYTLTADGYFPPQSDVLGFP